MPLLYHLNIDKIRWCGSVCCRALLVIGEAQRVPDIGLNLKIVRLFLGVGDEAERWAGAKKARWFEAVFGATVILRR